MSSSNIAGIRCAGGARVCILVERRASGEIVHVELTPGIVTMLAAWKLDAVYCAALKVGAPQVSLAALSDTAPSC